jgi:hypothetical protein
MCYAFYPQWLAFSLACLAAVKTLRIRCLEKMCLTRYLSRYEMSDRFRAASEPQFVGAEHGDAGVGQVDDGRFVRHPTVGLAEKDGFWKAVAHGMRR